ncbi:hypothetical protein [Ramlibacter sp.]|uniref:hypothetical protein n=1 Tax=Ramlibacter sp. TaxID=1917967 RepID=UPI0018502A11|nr:hypothetical protein [Ramlibacter sp.]MBA2672986.1 hypothetical protein [Ramlibacter sp.]
MSGESKRVAQLAEEIKFRGERMRRVDVLTLITMLPDDALLTTSEAAVFLRRSVSKMERMRVDGNGPPYVQDAPAPGSKATNLAVLYEKAAMKSWVKSHTASKAMDHAALQGRTFATLLDAVDEMAFYFDGQGRVEGAVENFTVAQVIEGLGRRRIVWMPAAEGCSRPWANLAAHKELADQVLAALSRSSRAIEQSLQATDIGEGLAELPTEPRRAL